MTALPAADRRAADLPQGAALTTHSDVVWADLLMDWAARDYLAGRIALDRYLASIAAHRQALANHLTLTRAGHEGRVVLPAQRESEA